MPSGWETRAHLYLITQVLPLGESIKIAALESKINELMVDRAGLAEGNANSVGSDRRSTSFLADGDAALEHIISRGFLNIETAERYLSNFKTKLTPNFPFVVVPPDVSAQQLRHEKPFLCLAILASGSYENMPLQRALGHEFKKVVASRMIIGGKSRSSCYRGYWYSLRGIITQSTEYQCSDDIGPLCLTI
ncbi:uncharacterized protein BDV17DRAFT_286844 [Aspergillus undulatus]|uniref:uncharacterized protein n=1 Tax=Aspergillus undulatus TaxID=1810928 RepID=UPI003CCD1A83